MNKTVLKVEGMSCNHCKMAVEKAVREVAGVEEALVNLEQKELTVTGSASREQLVEAVTKAGYEVKS
ncbi:copper chaperone [Desulfotomaculum arcticum]|uniref:Copper chaperone n=1 Tax=Desulfotruncus arcticus DSM 17038 TaxID=1121424 RepID=A0A1I2SXZ3_9FIRM|nr:cation transporter [Desulfotruncus arcticus]SFG57468.1 copper chaperone [Desulfotomaculum arcticum] [Desulfotruncus arcticus DSM 17038]